VTRAFVLSGGASLGAAQVGMLLALAEAGVRPDLIVGTSVGAVNGGWVACRADPDGVQELARLWRSLTRADVFPTRPLIGLLGFLGRERHLVPSSGLRRLLREHLAIARLEEAPIPLHVVATEVVSGQDVLLSEGDAVEAILASAAIPAVFPPVRVGGRDLMDGGVVNNTPISHAVALGAGEVWVLSTGYACALPAPPRGALGMALHALNLTVNQRLAVDVERYEATVELLVVPPLCPIYVSPADFSQSGQLIDRAHEATRAWLGSARARTGQARLVLPHAHRR
jgi:NTE family protein